MTSTDDGPLLRLLREHYGHRWTIWHTENLWIATANDSEADHAPTIIQPDVNEFLDELDNPPDRAGKPPAR
ncbi:hypothetical protein CDO52_05560 [Nocardiopsis gilva YIM 90087]|uniref:Uncharacterized protein n=1 Tax=Nocardiopsis gilva YIM 90087 TaxID=1235441 RepID=A0A223S2H2_9ACTN|nr:hypothetical protein [Nocardiopsis gilva]ASU82324.1 hypothetical protein CDO52_05560 [Nocardiopsis gilva YIM 90087]